MFAWINYALKSFYTFAGLSGDEFKFNKSTGDGPARYNIIHYKQVAVGKYDWVTVGDFHDGDIFLNMSGKISFMLDILISREAMGTTFYPKKKCCPTYM